MPPDVRDDRPTKQSTLSGDFGQTGSRPPSYESVEAQVPPPYPGDTKSPPVTHKRVRLDSGHLHWGRKDLSNVVHALREKAPSSTRQRFILASLCLANFLAYTSMSIIAPFYPSVADERGVDSIFISFVFSVYALVMLLLAPLCGYCVPIVGTKKLLFGGLLVSGAANVAFGFVSDIPVSDTHLFIAASLGLRALEAVGAASFATASHTIVMRVFPDQVSWAFAFIESSVAVGLALGPLGGALLYNWLGFRGPFVVLGGIVVGAIPLLIACLWKLEDIRQEDHSAKVTFLSYVRKPKVFLVLAVLIVSSSLFTFLDPTLEPFLKDEFQFGPVTIGLYFMSAAASFVITSSVAETFRKKVGFGRMSFMFIGLLLMAISLLVMGPAPIFNITPEPSWCLAGLILLGVGYGICYVPTMDAILQVAIRDLNMVEGVQTYAMVSGVWNCFNSIGEFTGPLLGMAEVPFPMYALYIGTGTASIASIVYGLWILNCLRENRCFVDSSDQSSSVSPSRRSSFSGSGSDSVYSIKSEASYLLGDKMTTRNYGSKA